MAILYKIMSGDNEVLLSLLPESLKKNAGKPLLLRAM